MKKLIFVFFVLLAFAGLACADQPYGISLVSSGTSKIYPVFDTNGWNMTRGSGALATHLGDDYYAQDWAMSGCNSTSNPTMFKKVYAGIAGKVVFAGTAGEFGNSVVIYDPQLQYALRVAHLDSLNVATGDPAIAGVTVLGRTGKTGNIAGSCPTYSGAHLHIVLYKGVTNTSARPVTSISLNSGGGGAATIYAVPFTYTFSAEVIKGISSSAVWVRDPYTNTKYFVTAEAYRSHGWNFSNTGGYMPGPTVWNPQSSVDNIPTGSYYWPFRSNTIIIASGGGTVYFVEDGAKRGVPDESTLLCLNNRWEDLVTISSSDMSNFRRNNDIPTLNSCTNDTQQAVKDMINRAKQDWRFMVNATDVNVFYNSYSATDMINDVNWEWHHVLFRLNDGRYVWMAHITYRYNPTERYTEFWDPDTQQNTGWIHW